MKLSALFLSAVASEYTGESAERWSTTVGEHIDGQGPFGGQPNMHKDVASENKGWTCPKVNLNCNWKKGLQSSVPTFSAGNPHSQGGNCKVVQDKRTMKMVNYCKEPNDQDLMDKKCCAYTAEGNLRDVAPSEYFPQKSKRCCHVQCEGNQQCTHGCNLWIAHSSLNWQSAWRPKLESKCQKTCQMSKDIKAMRASGQETHTSIHEVEKLNIKNVDECKEGCNKFAKCANNPDLPAPQSCPNQQNAVDALIVAPMVARDDYVWFEGDELAGPRKGKDTGIAKWNMRSGTGNKEITGAVTFEFDVTRNANKGKWAFQAEVLAPNDKDNEFHFTASSVDGMQPKWWRIPKSTSWKWVTIPTKGTFTEGSHSISILPREDGTKVRAVRLQKRDYSKHNDAVCFKSK